MFKDQNALSTVLADAERLHTEFLKSYKGEEPEVAIVDVRYKGEDDDEENAVIALTDEGDDGMERLSKVGYSDDDVIFYTNDYQGFIELCKNGDDFAITAVHYFE